MIGKESEPEWFDVEKGAIRKFAEAIGDPHPAYLAGEAAPPTFPTTFRTGYPPGATPGVDFDLSHVLHGEQEYDYERPLRAGDRIQVRQSVVDYKERTTSMGTMVFLTFESEGRDATGALVFRGRSLILIR